MEPGRDCLFARLFGEEANFRECPKCLAKHEPRASTGRCCVGFRVGSSRRVPSFLFSIGLLAGEDMRALQAAIFAFPSSENPDTAGRLSTLGPRLRHRIVSNPRCHEAVDKLPQNELLRGLWVFLCFSYLVCSKTSGTNFG